MQSNLYTSNQSQQCRPEWLRVHEAVRMFGIGRTSLYKLIGAGTIRSANIRKRGNIKGIRLIHSDSLANFIEAHREGGVN